MIELEVEEKKSKSVTLTCTMYDNFTGYSTLVNSLPCAMKSRAEKPKLASSLTLIARGFPAAPIYIFVLNF